MVTSLTKGLYDSLSISSPDAIRRPPVPFPQHEAPSADIGVRSVTVIKDKLNTPENLKRISGNTWDCILVEPGKNGGFIRTYRTNIECNYTFNNYPGELKYIEIDSEIFPAREPSGYNCRRVYLPKRDNSSNETKITQLFRDLGFCYWDDYDKNTCIAMTYIQLPDREALLASWQQNKEKYGIQHELDIIAGKGIAGHLEYAKAICDHDILLSDDKEFIHDMFSHVMNIIHVIFACYETSPTRYAQFFKERKQNIEAILHPIEALGRIQQNFAGREGSLPEAIRDLIAKKPILDALLGIYVDSQASQFDMWKLRSFDIFPETIPFNKEEDMRYHNKVFESLMLKDSNMHMLYYLLKHKLKRTMRLINFLDNFSEYPVPKSLLPPTDKELEKMSGPLGDCIDKNRGYLLFKLHTGKLPFQLENDNIFEFKKKTSKRTETRLDPTPSDVPPMAKIMEELGFFWSSSDIGHLLHLPDIDALMENWDILKKKYGLKNDINIQCKNPFIILFHDEKYLNDYFSFVIPALLQALDQNSQKALL